MSESMKKQLAFAVHCAIEQLAYDITRILYYFDFLFTATSAEKKLR